MSPLLQVLADPKRAEALEPRAWDALIGDARRTRLLGRLSFLLEDAGVKNIPAAAAESMAGTRAYLDHLHVTARRELASLERLPGAIGAPVVLLKGAAYLAAGLPVARGRGLNDIDILVPEAALPACEGWLKAAGWHFDGQLSAYDEHYYRTWAHELPPMRHPESHFELDVHHALVQRTNRLAFDPAPLFDAAVPIPGTPFHRLCDEDMILHVVAHLLVSDEPRGGLRDLDDLYRMLTIFDAEERLRERATALGLVLQLKHSISVLVSLFGGTLDARDIVPGMRQTSPSLVPTLLAWSAVPGGRPHHLQRLAERLLFLRAHWLRMPFDTLICHSARKLTAQY
ncbi:MAG: nucleotidyltransferase family protein [Pseudohaliea sp.]